MVECAQAKAPAVAAVSAHHNLHISLVRGIEHVLRPREDDHLPLVEAELLALARVQLAQALQLRSDALWQAWEWA